MHDVLLSVCCMSMAMCKPCALTPVACAVTTSNEARFVVSICMPDCTAASSSILMRTVTWPTHDVRPLTVLVLFFSLLRNSARTHA